MKICRFQKDRGEARIGLLAEDATLLDVSAGGVSSLASLLEADDLDRQLSSLLQQNLPSLSLTDVRLLPPIERQKVWAVGVTDRMINTHRRNGRDFTGTAI